jgi:hypothetical protein
MCLASARTVLVHTEPVQLASRKGTREGMTPSAWGEIRFVVGITWDVVRGSHDAITLTQEKSAVLPDDSSRLPKFESGTEILNGSNIQLAYKSEKGNSAIPNPGVRVCVVAFIISVLFLTATDHGGGVIESGTTSGMSFRSACDTRL